MASMCIPPVVNRDAMSTDPPHCIQTRLESLVDRIPDRYRLPTALHCFHGMGMDEIARSLNLPVSIVQSRLSRGVARLERMMGRAGLGGPRDILNGVAREGSLLSPPPTLSPSALFARAAESPRPARRLTVADLLSESAPRSLWAAWGVRLQQLSNRLVGSLGTLLL